MESFHKFNACFPPSHCMEFSEIKFMLIDHCMESFHKLNACFSSSHCMDSFHKLGACFCLSQFRLLYFGDIIRVDLYFRG